VKLKALNSLQLQHYLVRNIKRLNKEEAATRADRQVDVRNKAREIKQFLKKQKNVRQRREEERSKRLKNSIGTGPAPSAVNTRNPTRKNSALSDY
jgi:hypothetical protein